MESRQKVIYIDSIDGIYFQTLRAAVFRSLVR